MIIIGLTGSVGMGKSTVAAEFARLGAKIFDADKAVHKMLNKGGLAVKAVKETFPESYKNGAIDRKTLGAIVFKDEEGLRKLEAILHPMVREAEKDFICKQKHKRAKIVVFDIPLLFETGFEEFCDYVVVVKSPAFIQKRRVLNRSGMSRQKFAAILNREINHKLKERNADFIINTGLEKNFAISQTRRIYKEICKHQSKKK